MSEMTFGNLLRKIQLTLGSQQSPVSAPVGKAACRRFGLRAKWQPTKLWYATKIRAAPTRGDQALAG
jgi:hypothetical protein